MQLTTSSAASRSPIGSRSCWTRRGHGWRRGDRHAPLRGLNGLWDVAHERGAALIVRIDALQRR